MPFLALVWPVAIQIRTVAPTGLVDAPEWRAATPARPRQRHRVDAMIFLDLGHRAAARRRAGFRCHCLGSGNHP